MFTLSSARGAIANPALFARGGADVREGRVSGVTVEEKDGVLCYSGVVRGMAGSERPTFQYDETLDAFVSCGCSCAGVKDAVWGCRHVAALMIAVCGGAGEGQLPREGGGFLDELLREARGGHALSRVDALEPEPVRLYPVLRRESPREMRLGLKIGRARTYVVRSMAEFAARISRRERAVYGRELTFSHREDEVAPEDVPLLGQIAMLAQQHAAGAEALLSGAALDQTMRMLIGREVEIKISAQESRTVRVVRGDIQVPVELEEGESRALLRVFSQEVVLGSAGAYRIGETELVCAFGMAYDRIAGLLAIGAQFPQGMRFDAGQIEEVCTNLIVPAKEAALMRKGQAVVARYTPTPCTPKLYIYPEGAERIVCQVRMDYCGTELAPGVEHPHIRCDRALEEDVCAAAQKFFAETVREGEYVFRGGEEERFRLLCEQLPLLERVGEVHVARNLEMAHVTARRPMSFGLTREGEKLVLKAELGGFTQEDLTSALLAYRQKRDYVRLADGTFLSGGAMEQAAEAAQVLDTLDVSAEAAKAGAQVPDSRALYLEEALKNREQIRLTAPEAVESWIARLLEAQKVRAVQPAGLNAQLRGYQLEGLSWMSALSDAGFCGVLADDMGLGKTIQALALLLREKEKGEQVRALVVCPASLQLNWLSEAQRFAPGLSARALTGGADERLEAIGAAETELLITSYDQLRRDVKAYENIELSHVLLDEAQNIKNASSQAARAVKTLRARHRFAMTGTPIENRLSELWSIFDFLMPGYLLTYKKFKERFEAPVVREADERARENLHRMVAPFILRRMKKDVLSDLPEKIETDMSSEMTPEQRRLYAAYCAQLLRESEGGLLDGGDRIRMLAGLTRLRQLCCDPRLCLEGYKGGSGKLEQLLEIVQEALGAGHRLLVFSQFTSMLALIGEALASEGVAYLMLTGETEKDERMELVSQFNADSAASGADVFLISLKAGGTGLNLTGADVVIHYDPWWNVSAQNQATDRAYRIGQTKNVQVIRLIAAGTVEERILHIQESKKALSDGVLLGEENLFTLDAEQMRDLLRG